MCSLNVVKCNVFVLMSLLLLVELYSYTEESEFFVNKKCFDETSLAFCELDCGSSFVLFAVAVF